METTHKEKLKNNCGLVGRILFVWSETAGLKNKQACGNQSVYNSFRIVDLLIMKKTRAYLIKFERSIVYKIVFEAKIL